MRYIREYLTMPGGEYVYEFVVTGACNDTDPSAFNLISTSAGRTPIGQTNFNELWDYADTCEMEIEIRTKFEYWQRVRSTKGNFCFAILGVAESDAALLVLKFGDNIYQ